MIVKNRLIQTFIDLVKIASPSEEEDELSKFVAKKLIDLGGHVIFDSYGNIIAGFDGKGTPVMLNAHLDTVMPGRGVMPHVQTDKITSDGTTVLGGDAKAGIAAIIEAITSLKQDGKMHVPITVVFTVEEELGLIGALNLDYDLIAAKHGVVLDGQKSVQCITSSAPGYTRLDASVFGRAAHSGYEPEKGLSAIRIASEIILSLQEGRIDDETTANIGLIEGGSVRNAVPEAVHLKGEIRSRDIKRQKEIATNYEKVFSNVSHKYPNAKIDLTLYREFDPYVLDEKEEIARRAIDVLNKLELVPTFEPTGGGTDANIFRTKGINTICVGTGYYNAHTTREFVITSEMYDAARFCEQLVLV